MPKWYQGKVTRIENAGDNTKRFWIDTGDIDNFNFKPGQFITLDLPIGEKRLDRWRSYSIANAPGVTTIELCIVHLEGGRASGYFFNEVELGTEVTFKGPDGTFILPESDLQKTVVMVCTGTGIAPFRSMIQQIGNSGVDFHAIHLIFGTRYTTGMLYREELESLAKKYPNFRYSVALSREEGELPEYAEEGYVHKIYFKDHGDPSDNKVFYLCGWSQMIDEAVENLVEKIGYDRSQVKYELYG
jgi:CDP-4-dehydro-6-deoxyglucose reductase